MGMCKCHFSLFIILIARRDRDTASREEIEPIFLSPGEVVFPSAA
jgi:hypothetical protein